MLLHMPGVAQAGGRFLRLFRPIILLKVAGRALRGRMPCRVRKQERLGIYHTGYRNGCRWLIGGAAGALSSAFGGGTTSQEAQMAQGYTGAYDKYNPTQQAQMPAAQSPSGNIQYLQGLRMLIIAP